MGNSLTSSFMMSFSITGYGSWPAITARAITKASIGKPLEDSENVEFAIDEEDQQENGVMLAPFYKKKLEVGSSPPLHAINRISLYSLEQSQEVMMRFRLLGLLMEKSNISKGTGVKEVQ